MARPARRRGSIMSSLFRTRPRTENLTVLLTDIKGFTERTSSQSREESASWLGRHEALLGPVVRIFGGTRRKDIGDAWLVTFPSPTDAVRSAMAIQDRLWAYNRHVADEARIDVRAVLTQGEVQVSGGELIGEAVTMALKLEGLADAREVLLTESVYLAMNRKEAPTEEVGLRRVAGLPEAVRLYRAARVTHGDDGPPYGDRTLPPPPQLETVDAAWVQQQAEGRLASGSGVRTFTGEIEAVGQSVGQKMKEALEPIREAASHDESRRRVLVLAGGGAVAAVLALVVFTLVRALTGDPVRDAERLVDRGRHDEAAAAIGRLGGSGPGSVADQHYLRGYLSWAQDRPVDAATGYRRAIREDAARYAGHRRIRAQMLEALAHESCPVRRAAAETLGMTGRRDVLPALRTALEAEAGRERGRLGGLERLRCDFERAARRAIAAIEGGEA
jgi:adenylate cyclase